MREAEWETSGGVEAGIKKEFGGERAYIEHHNHRTLGPSHFNVFSEQATAYTFLYILIPIFYAQITRHNTQLLEIPQPRSVGSHLD